MKKNILLRHLRRELRHSIGRFVSLFAITALGAGFFVGLSSSGPNMLLTADKYFQDQKLADYRLLSTMGFTEDDITALRDSGDYSSVMAGYAIDVLVDTGTGAEPVRLQGLPDDLSSKDALNVPVVVEGRLPTADNECLADSASDAKIGDIVTLSAENDEDTLDLLHSKTFTVVGIAQSPYYIYFTRGVTNLKDGQLDSFYIVPESAFDSEFYLEVWLRDANAENISSFDDEYEQLQESAQTSLETFGEERAVLRLNEILDEADEELSEARTELADGIAELEDAKIEANTEFADAEAEIADGWAEINSAQQELIDGQNALNVGIAELTNARNELNAGQAAYDSGLAQYNDGLAQYESGVAALQKAQEDLVPLREGLKTLNESHTALSTKHTALSAYLVSLTDKIELLKTYTLPADEVKYRETSTEIVADLYALTMIIQQDSPQYSVVNGSLVKISEILADPTKDITQVQKELEKVILPALVAEIKTDEATLAILTDEVAKLTAILTPAEAEIAVQQPLLDAAKLQLDESAVLLSQSKAQLDSGYAQLAQAEIDANIAGSQADINSGYAELNDAKNELYTAQTELADAKAEAETEFANAEKDIADAQLEIADAEEELADLEAPTWIIQTREDQPGYSGYSNSVDSINAISGIFPLFFYLVSTLVCLTTMTRMVEENRGQIGTLKTLGYSRSAIAFQYLFYGALASFAGALVGAVGGSYVFPLAVWESYSIMYTMTDMKIALHPFYVTASIVSSVVLTCIATLGTCLAELRSVPAALMRPKAPRAGKRILLEYIKPLWTRMNFIQKVTSRNIFRYKSRFLMTIIGVAGCTALLLTGFGLSDTISSTFPLQFGKIYSYDAFLAIEDSSNMAADTELNKTLPEYTDYVYLTQKNLKMSFAEQNSGDLLIGMFIAEDPEKLGDFIHFYDVQNGEELQLEGSDGVFVTEKVADRLGISVGDTVTLDIIQDEKVIEAKVSGIVENYLQHYVYITPKLFESLTGSTPEYNSLVLESNGKTSIEDAMEVLLEVDNVAGSLITKELEDETADSMEGLNAVIWLATISASALAVVVLYNLTNINIIERTREIATLKVLGFYPKEFGAYIYRESFFLTLLGSLIGLVVGVFLHRIVLQVAEVDDLLFNIFIDVPSFVLSVVFTLLSLGIVDLLMFKGLKKIDMIESLKSIE